MRVYVPATLAVLAELHAVGAVAGPGRVAASEATEEAEYDALTRAAEASAALLEGPGRRVVVVAETTGPAGGPITMPEVVAVHVDTEDVDPGADPDELPDLGWFATQEIADLLG